MSEPGEPADVWIFLDGERIPARSGESVAVALLRSGERVLRWTPQAREPRGLFCVMGSCYDCIVPIDGNPPERACMTPVRDGMRITRPGRDHVR